MEASSPAGFRLRALAVVAACGAAFVGAHVWHTLSWTGDMLQRSSGALPQSQSSFALFSALHSAAVFAAFAMGTIAFARRLPGRFLWALPAAAFVAWPLPLAVGFGDGRAMLRPLLEPPGMLHPSLFAAGQLAAVLLAALPFALRREARAPLDASAVAAVALCGILAFFVYFVRQYGDVNTSMHLPLVFLFLAGAAISFRRGWFPAVPLLMALALSDGIYVVLDWAFPIDAFILPPAERLRALVLAVLPGVAAVGFGALTRPLAWYLRTRKRPAAIASPDPA